MSEVIYEDEYVDKGRMTVLFRKYGEGDYRLLACLHGEGTVVGAKAFVRMLDSCMQATPAAAKGRSMLDLRQSAGRTPLRSQLVLGRWLLKNKERVERLVLLGAPPLERKLATAVLKIARFKSVRFVESLEDGLAFLGWDEL